MAVTHAYPVQVDTSLAAVIAAAAVLLSCRYPRQPAGSVIGLNAMAASTASPRPGQRITAERPAAGASGAGPGGPRAWTPTRMAAVVTGTVLALCSIVLLGAGGTALWADTGGRHGGYVSLGSQRYHSSGYAVAAGAAKLHALWAGWDAARPFLGTVRIRATATTAGKPAFIGIAAPRAASDYLTGVAHTTVRSAPGTRGVSVEVSGAGPATPPARATLWAARSSGPGTPTVTWPVGSGNWTMVVMNADGSRPVNVSVNVAASLPALTGIAVGLLTAGAICLVAGAILIVITIRQVRGPTALRQREHVPAGL